MCGITGFFSTEPLAESSQDNLAFMLDMIHHRGPDGRGMHVDGKNGLAMGHARLSINDLETGHQPLKSLDGDCVLTVNGEFYDFKRHRSTMMAQGDRFGCKSDSEIALGLYRQHGLDFVQHLRGEFAFSLYDRREDALILVRDRFGIRPLFFHNNGKTLFYGSEVKALLAHPAIPRELDPEAVLHQLMQTMVPGTSAFRSIHALLPGHMMIVKRRGQTLDITTRRYWDLNFPERGGHNDPKDEQRQIESIRDELVRSVVFRLEADVPVGCYLSGGIDSCCILGLATGAMQSPVKAFTISFDHADYDESAIAREMAESMNADQEVINLKAEDLYGDNYINTVWHAERTFYNTLGVAKNLMSRRVRECGYKTVITGEGSDELFGGYPAFKRDMFMHGLADEPEDTRRAYQAMLEESNKLFKGAILSEDQHHHPAFDSLCGFTPSWIQPWIATEALARPLLSPDLRESLKNYDPIERIASQLDTDAMRNRHPLDKAQYTWVKTMLEGQILNWGGDRVDMANSMESRPAFLDHYLAEKAVMVPPTLRIKGNIEKWILREAVKGVLPEVLYKREKFAFMAPPAHTDKAKQKCLGTLIDQFLSESAIKDAGVLDPVAITRFISDYRNDKDAVSLTRKDALINHLLGIQILHHHFVAQTVKPHSLTSVA